MTLRLVAGLICAGLALVPLMAEGADPVSAGSPIFRATLLLESDTAWRLRSPRRLQKSQNRAELDFELDLSDSLEFHGLVRLLYDPAGRLLEETPPFDQEPLDRWQIAGSRHLEGELRELFFDWNTRWSGMRVNLRIGKQQVVWGQSFGIRVLDIVNAQTFREFILDDFVDARTPVFGGRLDLDWRGWSVQTLVFPDFEPDVIPDPESEYALDLGLPGLLPAFQPLGGATNDPGFWVEFGRAREPHDWRFNRLGLGFRVARHLRGFDLALMYWNRYDPNPVQTRRIESRVLPVLGEVSANIIEARHFRVHTVGFSFARAWGDFSFWGEGGLSLGRAFVVDDLSDSDGVVRRPDLQFALGLDWTGFDPLFANLQWIQLDVLDYDSKISVDHSRNFLSFLFRFDLLQDTLFPQLFLLYGLNDSDSMIRPSLEWSVSDRTSLTIGADLFTGRRAGLLGQYANDRACPRVPQSLPGGGECFLDSPPGRTNRIFLRLRFETHLGS